MARSHATEHRMGTPLVLAFDTASDQLALAVGTLDGTLLACDDHPARREANVQLVPSIDRLLATNNLRREDIACVVCGQGPGSFTGVRIAIATAKGIARGLGVPLYGVSTLDALAWGAWLKGLRGTLGVVADAMRGEVYPARFEIEKLASAPLPQVLRRDAHAVAKADVVAQQWKNAAEPMTLIGDGLHKFADVFMHADRACCFTLAPEELWVPTGHGLLQAFWASRPSLVAATPDADPARLLPIYTRLSDAEENERARLAANGAIAQGALVEVPRSGVTESAWAEHIVYRPMAACDLDAVVALETQVFAPQDGQTALATSGECWTKEMFADELPRTDRSWWVAYEGDSLAGFAGGWVVDGQLHVLDIAVDSTRRRQGIASELMRRLMDDAFAWGAHSVTLEVRASNTDAQAFYAALGLEKEGVRPRYYAPRSVGTAREDAYILTSGQETGQKTRCDDAIGVSWVPASPRILAIETSCDETAAAVMAGNETLLSNVVASQVGFHARFGGVVPEIASRKHIESIVSVVDAALMDAGLPLSQVDAVAVTYAPGLVGALVVGVAFAKGLSWAAQKPLIRVNHLEGHIYSNRLDNPELEPPFVIALLSGGNTMLVHACAWGDYRILGQTLDDAVGEAFDKVAKALGLGYPGGPAISRLAETGDPRAIPFPRALINSKDLRFSLSGLKTAVVTYIRQEQRAGRTLNMSDIAASFEAAVIDVQVAKALDALEQTRATTFCLGGGVAANRALRKAYCDAMQPRGIRVIMPEQLACTDNAAMIAAVALDRYREGRFASLDTDAFAHANLEHQY